MALRGQERESVGILTLWHSRGKKALEGDEYHTAKNWQQVFQTILLEWKQWESHHRHPAEKPVEQNHICPKPQSAWLTFFTNGVHSASVDSIQSPERPP